MDNATYDLPRPISFSSQSTSTELIHLEAFDKDGKSISCIKVIPYTNAQLRETPGLVQWVTKECESVYARAGIFADAMKEHKMYMGRYIHSYFMQVGTQRCDYAYGKDGKSITFNKSYVIDIKAMNDDLQRKKEMTENLDATSTMVAYDLV